MCNMNEVNVDACLNNSHIGATLVLQFLLVLSCPLLSLWHLFYFISPPPITSMDLSSIMQQEDDEGGGDGDG